MTIFDRTDYVQKALVKIPNRFELCRLTAKAVRGTNTPEKQVSVITNDALRTIARSEPAPIQWMSKADYAAGNCDVYFHAR